MDPLSNGAADYMSLAEELTGCNRPENWKEKALLAWIEKRPKDDDAKKIAVKELKLKIE